MKKNYFLFLIIVWGLTFVSPVMLSAKVTDTRDIELRTKTDNGNELRSLPPVRAWIDNQTVYVLFLDLPSIATVVITNVETGGSVTTSFSSQKMLSVSLEEKGKYRIDINYDSEFFEGNFKW